MAQKPIFRILILVLLLTGTMPSEAKNAYGSTFSNSWNTIVLDMNNGLPHNFVDDFTCDSNGFIWLALQGGGLARYDGYKFVTYSPGSKYHHINSTFVTSLAEDGFRRLWVGSDQGVDVLSLSTLAEADVLNGAEAGLREALQGNVTVVRSDGDGRIWIQCGGSVVCVWFDATDGAVAGYAVRKLPAEQESHTIVKSKAEQPALYALIGNELRLLTIDSNGQIADSCVAEELHFPADTHVLDLLEYGNELWIATNGGLYRYDRNEHLLRHYEHVPGDTTSLSQNGLTSLALSPDRRIVVGSLKGLNIYNPIRDSFEQIYNFENDPSGGRMLSNNFVHSMMTDSNRLFVATEGGGLNILVPRTLNATLITHRPGDSRSLSPLPVNSIYYGPDGVEYVGTVEGGLNVRKPGSTTYSHLTEASCGLSHNSVSALAGDSQGRLWVGTWGGGLNVLSGTEPADIALKLMETPEGQPLSYIGVLMADSINHGMWVGSNTGLWFCDGDFRFVSPMPRGMKAPSGSVGAAIDRRGHLWVGGSDGLYDFDLHSRKGDGSFACRRLSTKLDMPDSNIPERISYVYEDAKGTLWVGSNGNGLYKRVTDKDGKETFVNYSTANGLANNHVRSMLDDSRGNLWVATYHGLSLITPEGRIVSYGPKDGLGSAQFYWNAAAKSPDGRLMFGSVDGLVSINGLLETRSRTDNHIKFTRVMVGNEESHPGDGHSEQDVSMAKKIRLHERDKSLFIEFSALDYGHTGDKRYYYRMYPFEEDWIELPAGSNYVSYANLPSGDYTFEVCYASSADSPADAQQGSIEVVVEPYFYKTTWFYILMVLAALAVVALCIWLKTRRLTRQNRHLEKMVEERMAELQKSHLEHQQAREQIGEQQTQIADMERRVNELTLDQISFFTNITHEFRTPIALIIGPIQRALRLSHNPQVIEQLNYVERNSKYLLSLVNQLMDFRKVESGKYDIVRTRGNFVRYADEILTPFEALASERGITLRRIYHMPHPIISFDEDAIRKILTNLLGNAVKFTPDDGEITVYVALLGSEQDSRLYISVCDTGCGIPDAELGNVFDRFFSGKSQIKYPVTGALGSGIGLYLCKNIIDLYGGEIGVRNNRGGCGCTFRLQLPAQRVDAAEAEQQPAAPDRAGQTDETSAADGRTVILVVEDNPDMRGFIASILRDTYTVVEAENGEEAMKILLDRQIDFIVTDLMMPVMDGIELSRRVKENFAISHIPLLMLTAKTSNESRLESFRIGVDEFLSKPFDEQILLTRIRNILENKRRYQSRFNVGMDVDALNIADDSRDKRFIDEVMEVIKNNYRNSSFDVSDFAEALGVSRSLLNKKLQSLVGESALKLIRNFRMNMARELIMRNRDTRAQNISEIAYEVGFNDSKYFTRCFTKHFGITPSAMLDGENA